MNTKPKPFDIVSSATLRDSDLLRAMLETLEYYRPKKYKELIQDGKTILDIFGDFGYIVYLKDVNLSSLDFAVWASKHDINDFNQLCDYLSWLIYEDIYSAMQDISPADCFYGANFGDGSLLGFWPNEDSPLWE